MTADDRQYTPDRCPHDDWTDDGAECLQCGTLAEPLDDDGAAELAALIADRLPPLDGPGFATGAGPARDWSYALRGANAERRGLVARQRLTDDELAGAAARSGLVPGALPATACAAGESAGTGPERGIELVNVYGGIRACAEVDRLYRANVEPRAVAGRNGWYPSAFDVTNWRAYPGDLAADYDASAERFELSPSGAWHVHLPPAYAAGVAQLAAWHHPRGIVIDSTTHRTRPDVGDGWREWVSA